MGCLVGLWFLFDFRWHGEFVLVLCLLLARFVGLRCDFRYFAIGFSLVVSLGAVILVGYVKLDWCLYIKCLEWSRGLDLLFFGFRGVGLCYFDIVECWVVWFRC